MQHALSKFSVGIDLVEVARFAHWHRYSRTQLARIFSEEEINYCLLDLTRSAERFAVRFAAREACYKAISQLLSTSLSFLTFCSLMCVKTRGGIPQIKLAKEHPLLQSLATANTTLSLSHTATTACAVVIVTY